MQLSSLEGYPAPHVGCHSTTGVLGDWDHDIGIIQHQMEGIRIDTNAIRNDFQAHLENF
jgi:hypothetical protein